MQFKARPYNLFLLTGLVLILISFFTTTQTLDLHLHDTYFVISLTYIFGLLAIASLILWGIYLLTFRFLFSKKLTWTHIIITILTVIVFGTIVLIGDKLATPTTGPYYDFSTWESYGRYRQYSTALVFVLGLLLLGQFIYVLNLILGVLKRQT